jgi:hypothetical protein
MNEQLGVALDFYAFYTANKVGKTGLSTTVGIRDRAGTVVLAAGTTGVVELGLGGYRYTMAANLNTSEGGYFCVFSTADTTVDQKDIPALWVTQKAGVEHLDADVSTRAATADARFANLDALISSRNAVAPDNASIATLIARLTAARATALDNLDTTVSSRNSIAPDNASIATLVARLTSARAALLDHLDADISSRNAVAPDNAGVATLVARLTAGRATLLDLLAHLDADVSSRNAVAPLDAVQTAGAVWDAQLIDHVGDGSVGLVLTQLDAPVSSRMFGDMTQLRNVIWAAPVSFAVGTIGQYLQVFLQTLVDRLTAPRAALLDNLSLLDVLVSSVAGSPAPTALEVTNTLLDLPLDVRGILTGSVADFLRRLDATVGSRMDANSYVTPPAPTSIADEVAPRVWETATADHGTPGTMGAALGAAGGAADPLANQTSGYPAGSAGAALDRIGAAAINVRSPVNPRGVVTIYRGDDYLSENGRSLAFEDVKDEWPSGSILSVSTIEMVVVDSALTTVSEYAGSYQAAGPGGHAKLLVELTSDQTLALAAGQYYTYRLRATTDGFTSTLVSGTLRAV